MKKLMIAMSAAAICALSAQAAAPVLAGAEDFETGYTKGDPIVKEGYWLTGGGDSVVATANEDGTGNKFLKVDATDVLQRGTATKGEGDTWTNGATIPENGGNIAISTDVQFTAADEAPTVAEGDKLLVWAKAPAEEGGDIKVCVTSMDAQGDPMVTETDLVVKADTWYTLVITATENTAESALAPMQFMVKLGENEAVGPFTSLVDGEKDGATTIASVGFKGTGAVDNIAFTATEGAVPVKVTVTCNVDVAIGSELTPYDPETGIASVDGKEIDLYVEGAAADVTCEQAKSIVDAEGDLEGYAIVTVVAAKDLAVTITVQTEPQPPAPIVPSIVPTTAVVTGVPEGGFVVGTEYDTADIKATPSAAHKSVTVVVKVNDEVVEGKFTLKAGDTVTIEVTESDITFTLTIPEVTGATADVTTGPVVEGTEVTITWTAVEGYKITAGATQTITITEDTTAATPTVVAINYVTVTIETVDNCTITVKKGEETVESGAKFDADDAVELTVTREAATGYELDNCAATETITMTKDTTITAAVKTTGGDLPNYLKDAPAAVVEKYNTWAAKYGADTASENEDAFLLNCDPAEVDAAKAAFKFTAIVPGETPVIEGDFNGEVVVKAYEDAACTIEGTGETATFYKAELVMPKAK